jgi:hypothetical protein
MNIHKALSAAMNDICRIGIGKNMRNQQQGYHFRGVEQAMNEMSPIFVRHGITVTPHYSELTITERVKGDPADGKATRFCTIKGAFTFSVEDGSSVTSEAYGEAMDSGDKAVIKAQSVAFRTALFQQFVVPTMAMDPEADAPGDEPPELDAAHDAALDGTASLRKWWSAQTEDVRARLDGHLQSLKDAAKKADAEKKP